MRCKACDKKMTDVEQSKKNENGDYEELCSTCLFEAGVYLYIDDTDVTDDELDEVDAYVKQQQ